MTWGSVRHIGGLCSPLWGIPLTNPLHRGVKCIDGPPSGLFVHKLKARRAKPLADAELFFFSNVAVDWVLKTNYLSSLHTIGVDLEVTLAQNY